MRNVVSKSGVWMGLAILSYLLSSSAMAEPPGRERTRHHEKRFNQMIEQLDLTSAQKKKIDELRKSQKEKLQKKHEAKREAGKKFHEAMGKDAKESELRKLFKRKQKAKMELDKARFEMALEVRQVLTPEQRKKFHMLKKEQKKHRKKLRQFRKQR